VSRFLSSFSRWFYGWGYMVFLVVLFLMPFFFLGCSSGPTRVSRVVALPDSGRYVNMAGTPTAIATVWSHGVVNVSMPVQVLVYDRNTPCLIGGTVSYRCTRLIYDVTGPVTAVSPGFVAAGMFYGTLKADTLRGIAGVVVQTPCGPSDTLKTPVCLVRE
jgi:hypothetical protein